LKLFIDECLSPALARHLNQSGAHDALHPRDYGRLGERDDEVLARCLAEDRVIVTENAADFRKLVAREDIHPGLIILPNVTRDASLALLLAAIAYLEALGSPQDVIVNHVLEIDADGSARLYPLP
jgi:predicted nuclease of predicted toxin-antitoxin system